MGSLGEANGLLPDLPEQRPTLAEEVIGDLLTADLTNLYRGPWVGDDYVEVPADEVDAMLRQWGSGVTDQDPLIWFTSTGAR